MSHDAPPSAATPLPAWPPSPVERLLAEQACRDLVARAAQATDSQRHEDFAALFTPDGVLTRPGGEPLRGREAIVASYRMRPAARITRHLVTGGVIELESPTRARGLSVVLLWSGDAADAEGPFGRPAQRQALGEFEDEFALTAEGWRIARREARFVLVAP
ncbi:nuclear transport factor 2 family protein [Azohydromonas aeria]|uniref:nuclear transport factor 2 family protein n=1 Tax=Azohydromonas aeria TaxID=2590212 RepID=UPI0012FC9FB6|nr:nuclear transport factor 2 family protein [Azohydromonas aeria]